jgi:dihydroxyacetone kinase
LWGIILRNLGNVLGDETRPNAATVAAGMAAALHGVTDLGKAHPGDKTLVDVLHPFSAALAAGASRSFSISATWTAAADIAAEAAEATRNLLPRIGRARPHAERSIGTPDPGAISMALIIRSVEKTIREHCS